MSWGATDDPQGNAFKRPVAVTILLAVAFVVISGGGTLSLGALMPTLEGKNRDLIVEIALALFVVGIIALLRWRETVGINGPSSWRHLPLLILPLLVVLVPFAGGFKGVDTGTLGVLLVGYAANSIAEDGMFRGILPQVLRSKGLVWAVVLSSLLFGLTHFGNLISRPDQSVAITAAQALGAFTHGIGLVALRLAFNSVVPIMAIHFLEDLFLQLGGMSTVVASVIESVVLLVYGIWVLRTYRAELAASGWR